MQHQAQYWLTCPECGHQMEVGKRDGPLRAKYCDKCDLLFSFTNEELAVAESVGTADLRSAIHQAVSESALLGNQ